MVSIIWKSVSRLRLKCDCTRAETRFRLLAKRTSPFKSAGGRQFSRLLAAEMCVSAVVMQDTACSEVVWRVLATHSTRHFPLHFPTLLHRVPSQFNWTLQHSFLSSSSSPTSPSSSKSCSGSVRRVFCSLILKMKLVLPSLPQSSEATAVAQWLRCCATNRKVAYSIPAGVIGIFHWHKILPIALWLWGRLSH